MPSQTHLPRPTEVKLLAQRRKKWVHRVDELLDRAESWSLEQDWSVARQTKLIDEPPLEAYEVPALRIRTPQGEVHLDPVGSLITGAEGRVDLQAWPSLNRVRFIWRDGSMFIITDSNVPIHQAWNRKTFIRLVNDLLTP